MTTRRQFLGGLAAVTMMPTWARAAAAGGPVLIAVTLRGAMDGLHAFPVPGDPDYGRARKDMALPREGLLDLDGTFAMHPALERLAPLYAEGELLVAHAVGTGYRGRSHFDGQDHLESALADRSPATGWLGRALLGTPTPSTVVAIGQREPLVVRGAPGLTTIDPEASGRVGRLDEMARALYADDPLLGPAIEEAFEARAMLAERPRRSASSLGAAGALVASSGATAAAVDIGGWDTHVRQGGLEGQLANRLRALSEGLADLREALGPTWARTVVVVTTEFGRTVAGNGTGGTDHGTGGVAMLLGGAVAGGRVLSDWPGLAAGALLEGRDLRPTQDLHALLAGVVEDHLGVSGTEVFPGVSPVRNLVRG